MPGEQRDRNPNPEIVASTVFPDMTDYHHDSDLPEDRTQDSRRSFSRSEQKDAAGRPVRRSNTHRHHGRDRHEEATAAEEEEKRPYTQSKSITAQSEQDSKPLYWIDRKGDPDNILYGGNQNSTIPRYHRVGYGSVIGLDRRHRISKDGAMIPGYGVPDNAQRGSARSLLSYRDNPKLEEKVSSGNLDGGDDGIKLQHAYVAVDETSSKRRKRKATMPGFDNALQMVMEQSRSNVSRHDQKDASGSSGSGLDSSNASEEEPDAYDVFRNERHQQRSTKLSRTTIERPKDIDAWLTLIQHQAYTFGMHDSENEDNLSRTEKRSLAEMRLALYEKALTKFTDAASRERLILGLMDQGSLLWDTEILSRKWQDLFKTGSSMGLHIRHLNFRQINTNFSYEDCLSIHQDCLRRAFLEEQGLVRDGACLYILLRTTTFMSQSGYLERATAIWQSLLEFTFYRPRQLELSKEQSSFQEFWESEVPRIGEAGAAGWGSSKAIDVSKTALVHDHTPHDDVYRSWARRENETAMNSGLSARSLDNVAEDDPFRVTLFADIEEYLFSPNTAAGRLLLLDAFLKFCGLPALYRPGLGLHRKWWSDSFLAGTAEQIQPLLGGETAIADSATLFSAEGSRSAFSPPASATEKANALWQRAALKQLVDSLHDDDNLAEYVIAMEASFNLKEARKYAKTLLKGRPSNLRLYNDYASLECRLDRFEIAEHTWATAISMCPVSSLAQQQNHALLWCTWLWESLRRRMLSRAQQILLSVPGGRLSNTAPGAFENATSRMRVKSDLESHLAQYKSLRQEEGMLYYTELLAIFEYLASSQFLPCALEVYSTTLETLNKIEASSTLIEVMHQSRARLLHLHPLLSPRGYRPAEINLGLAESLRMFPDNSMFHQLYQDHIRHSGLLERIREIIPERSLWSMNVEHDTMIIPSLFAIQAELSRPGYAGSTHHSIRAAFERGVAAVKSCVRIWTWYIRWETSLNSETPLAESSKFQARRAKEVEMRRNRAVDVYYRGIRACPWAKQLSMLAFSEGSLRKAIGDVELRKIYDGMMETGLRIHVDLDQSSG